MKLSMRVVQGRPAGKNLVFPPGNYYFGRGAECHVRPNSDWVSRQHCLLRVTEDSVFLRDLCSRNGTLVNGTLLECERCLQEGDQVQVGPLVFEVHFEASAAAPRPLPLPSAAELHPGDTLTLPAMSRLDGPHGLKDTKSHPALPTAVSESSGTA